MAALPVVFVLSSNYSGSHLLAQVLAAHPRCADLGELRNLGKFSRQRTANVSGTSARFADSELFRDLLTHDVGGWHSLLYERLRTMHPDVDVLVDNSKRLDWVARFIADGAIDVRCIHLLRDPRALAHRWASVFVTARDKRRIRLREAKRQWSRAWRILIGSEAEVYAQRWLRENRAITRFLDAHQPTAPRLCYEQLVRAPEAGLRALMPALGLDFDAAQLEYWTAPQHGTRKPAWSGPEARSWRLDLRWRDEMSTADAGAVTQLPELAAYVGEQGFDFTATGLAPVGQNRHRSSMPGTSGASDP